MTTKKGIGRDARRIARREARLEEKQERSGGKAAPALSPRMRNILLIGLGVLLVLLGMVWLIADSRSFVAKVDGRRIRNEEYNYFLKLQQGEVEAREGLDTKTDEERKAFWAQDAVDGENPILRVKNDALDTAKEYAIQLQKAGDMGLSVDDNIREMAKAYIDSIKQSLGAYYETNLADMGLTDAKYAEILRNYYLIDAFRARYIKENHQAAEITEEASLAVYEKDPNLYDKVSARVIYLAKTNAEGAALEESALADKKKLAEEILAEIEAGADMETLAKERSESESANDNGGIQSLTFDMQSYTPEIINWAFSAEMGVPAFLDTSYGFFIVRAEERTGFEDADASIRSELAASAEEAYYTAQLDAWMKEPEYNVVLKENVFEKFTVE